MNTKEIRNLRNKFIRIAMLSFSLVVFLVGTTINLVNYMVSQREIDWSLEKIVDLRDAIEEETVRHKPEAPSFSEVFSPSYQSNIFYIISYDTDGNEDSFYASKGNTYPNSVIRETANIILNSTSIQGRHGLYYYTKTTELDGTIVLVILDSSYVIYSRMRLLYASVIVGGIGLLATLFLVFVLSKKMIRPEIESNKNQIQFLTNVSHELKTPLAVIRSNAEMEVLSKGESEWMHSTLRQVDRMNGLVKNLVMITKCRELEETRPSSPIVISDVVSETIKEFYAMAENEGKTLAEKIEPNLTLSVDESRIRQLVTILIDNAVKYCDAGGDIFISLEQLKRGWKNIRLIVSNSYARGGEIDCRHFFERFYRGDPSHNIDTGGYGIGLSIAQSICEQYNGSIKVDWKGGKISFICDMN